MDPKSLQEDLMFTEADSRYMEPVAIDKVVKKRNGHPKQGDSIGVLFCGGPPGLSKWQNANLTLDYPSSHSHGT